MRSEAGGLVRKNAGAGQAQEGVESRMTPKT